LDTTSLGRGPPSVVDCQSTESSGLEDFSEQVWQVLSERGQSCDSLALGLGKLKGSDFGHGAGVSLIDTNATHLLNMRTTAAMPRAG